MYKNGDKITTKTEYISDVDTRIKARKELDRLLGISALQPLGQISAGGNVNIMIVDASKRTRSKTAGTIPFSWKCRTRRKRWTAR